MTGINLAEQLIKDKKNKGIVIALGTTIYNERYVIIHLDGGRGRLYQIDYGCEIRLDPSINLEDKIELKKIDECISEWITIEKGNKKITR